VANYAWSSGDIRKLTEEAVNTIYPKVAKMSPRCAKLVESIKKQMKDYGRIS
jgi:hypothetical protein